MKDMTVSILFGVVILLLAVIVCFSVLLIRRQKEQKKQKNREKTKHQEVAATSDLAEKVFLPVEMLELLEIRGKEAVTVEKRQKPKELKAVIFHANIAGFSQKIRAKRMEQVYELINETLSSCIPEINRKGGLIDHFQNAGLVALFTGEREAALAAAVSICEEMIRKEDCAQDFSIGLCYGNIMVGVVGAQQRMSVLTLSSHMGFGAFLQKKAPFYYATILAAESYIKQVEGFQNQYNYRFLGYFYLQDIGQLEAVYDVFDGDRAEIRNRKRKTKLLFEKGVRLFEKRSFAEARTYFIEVLKADRYDAAAREYVFRCDKYSSMTKDEQENVPVYLESY